MTSVVVSGSFDDIRARQVRLLEEAAKLGTVTVNLWSDDTVRKLTGANAKLTEAERMYFVAALRTVNHVNLVDGEIDPDRLPEVPGLQAETWIVFEEQDTPQKRAFCKPRGISYHVIPETELARIPETLTANGNRAEGRKKVVVTGCFDWLHSGHVRFFEESSALGDLTVVLGHDENVLLLKGEGHPLFPGIERRYMVQSIRYVTQALLSTGSGWMDAAPEINLLKPDMYVVNEDGDKPEKKAFCEADGIEYVVLKRLPKEGLPRRESTALRGF